MARLTQLFFLSTLRLKNLGIHQSLDNFITSISCPGISTSLGTRWDFSWWIVLHKLKVLIWIIEVGKRLTSRSMSLPDGQRKPAHTSAYPRNGQRHRDFGVFRHDPLLGSKRSNSLNQVTVFRRTFKLHTLCLLPFYSWDHR